MTEEEIFNKIADMILECFSIDRDKVTKGLNFQDNLDTDLADFVELVMDLGDTFGAEIPDNDVEKLQTVDETVEYIENHQS